jgi:hypothetical protein
VFGEYFQFKYVKIIKNDYTEVFVPVHLTLTLDLMFYEDDDVPSNHTMFAALTSRTLSMTIDWRRGLHAHWPVLFDYFHMAAVGVTAHASLYTISSGDVQIIQPHPVARRNWFSQNTTVVPPVSYMNMLFGAGPHIVSTDDPGHTYQVPVELLRRGREVHRDISNVITSARDNLREGYQTISGDANGSSAAISNGPMECGTTLEEVLEECESHMHSLSIQLQVIWEWFCRSVVGLPDTIHHLAKLSLSTKIQRHLKCVLYPDSELVKLSNDSSITSLAPLARRSLTSLPSFYCVENLETVNNASVMMIELCPWAVRRTSNGVDDGYRQESRLYPYLMSSMGTSRHRQRRHRSSTLHLIVCVHGLQGNQFDLRLYRTFLELSLPNQQVEFLMSQANQYDTFTDFNIMTDKLQEEVLSKLISMPHPPTHISFLAHSLGGVVVRTLVTRPAMSHLIPLLHLFMSICGPHLGTQHQNGVVSAGMWVVQKWYHSQSLLQLSLKDSPDFRDSFLYHLSESQTFECFRHVVLLSSPQDKYVPQQSAHLLTGNEEGTTLLAKVLEEMAVRMMTSMEHFGVDLVRVTVHHSLPTSAHSVIGRAAHIAMLDNDLFVEKFILCHISKYFL